MAKGWHGDSAGHARAARKRGKRKRKPLSAEARRKKNIAAGYARARKHVTKRASRFPSGY